MAVSDAILKRLLALHPKIIDLSLHRMWRILERLGHPERRLPSVIHVAGTNGKGSTSAYLQAQMEAARLKVHVYTSPHLIHFHERIRLAFAVGQSRPIRDEELTALLEECEAANANEPITFFEITTAAAFLAFSRIAADYLILEVGLGGRLDATNVVERPVMSVITMIDYDHQHYLGNSLQQIAREKAGILKPEVPGIVGRQAEEALAEIEARALEVEAPLEVCGRDWQSFAQNGRLVYQDERGLLDLPLPRLAGSFQIDNAGIAIAALRCLKDRRITDQHLAEGLKRARWPGRMQRLAEGQLTRLISAQSELWLDGGHNASAGQAVAQSLAQIEERSPKPLIIILGMLKSKDAASFIRPFKGLAQRVVTLTIPEEANSYGAEELEAIVRGEGFTAEPGCSIIDAIAKASASSAPVRILITGSLYLAGHVLAQHDGIAMSAVSGASR
jgi:dihydrofolate synthase / folylpolyglutamate synthase